MNALSRLALASSLSLAACSPDCDQIDGHRFIRDHINLLLDGLVQPPLTHAR